MCVCVRVGAWYWWEVNRCYKLLYSCWVLREEGLGRLQAYNLCIYHVIIKKFAGHRILPESNVGNAFTCVDLQNLLSYV